MSERESILETKSGESSTKEAKTCVFRDVDDCPIPNALDPDSIYQNIKSALANNGNDGNLEIKLYSDKEKSSYELLLDAGFTFVPKEFARVMIFDMIIWAKPNPKSNLMVISQDVTKDRMLVDTVYNLGYRGRNVLLAQSHELHRKLQSDPEVLPPAVSQLWIVTSLLHGEAPIIGQRGHKPKSLADTVADFEDNPCSV